MILHHLLNSNNLNLYLYFFYFKGITHLYSNMSSTLIKAQVPYKYITLQKGKNFANIFKLLTVKLATFPVNNSVITTPKEKRSTFSL